MFEPHEDVQRVLEELRRGPALPEPPNEPDVAPEALLAANRKESHKVY